MADYTISEEYVLPSKGKIYDIPFDPRVKLRPMTIAEVMKRQSKGPSINWTLCDIIQDCLITKLPIPVYDLAVPDFEFLLYKLRIVTHGKDYKMSVGCPHCKDAGRSYLQQYTADLDALKVVTLDDEGVAEKLENCREFKLPICGSTIKLRIPTPRLQDMIQNKIDDFNKKDPENTTDMSILFTLETMIEAVDGRKLGYIELQQLIKKMHAHDYNFLSQKLNKLTALFGINKLVQVKCPKCGGEFQSIFRVTSEFFGPSID